MFAIFFIAPFIIVLANMALAAVAKNNDSVWNFQSRRARAKAFKEWRRDHSAADWNTYVM